MEAHHIAGIEAKRRSSANWELKHTSEIQSEVEDRRVGFWREVNVVRYCQAVTLKTGTRFHPHSEPPKVPAASHAGQGLHDAAAISMAGHISTRMQQHYTSVSEFAKRRAVEAAFNAGNYMVSGGRLLGDIQPLQRLAPSRKSVVRGQRSTVRLSTISTDAPDFTE